MVGFFEHLAEKELDEKLWEFWINKETGLSFDEFKSKSVKTTKTRQASEEDAKHNLANAERILKIGTFKEMEVDNL